MKIRLSRTLYNECDPAMEDAVANKERGRPDPSDPVYLKLLQAKVTKGGVVVDVDADELKELRSRFDYLAETAKENMEWESERMLWLGRLNAARAFLKATARYV